MLSSPLIAILIIAIIAVLGFWIVDRMGMPAPIDWIVKIILGVILLVALLNRIGIAI